MKKIKISHFFKSEKIFKISFKHGILVFVCMTVSIWNLFKKKRKKEKKRKEKKWKEKKRKKINEEWIIECEWLPEQPQQPENRFHLTLFNHLSSRIFIESETLIIRQSGWLKSRLKLESGVDVIQHSKNVAFTTLCNKVINTVMCIGLC